MLLNSKAAGVSALAGYTVHPQGFCAGVKKSACAWLEQYFVDFNQAPQQELDNDHYAAYSLTESTRKVPSPLPDCILWDTPDFDSIDAAVYREGVLRTIALADILILVVSKEKYADQSVWEMMTLLEPLRQPTLVVVNKLVEQSQFVVLKSFQDKWRQARTDAMPGIIPLQYQSAGKLQSWPQVEFDLATRVLTAAVKNSNRRKHPEYQQQYLNSHWQSWLEPVMAEYSALGDWQKMLDASIKESLGQFQRDYLDHPHHYETFQSALLELLTLLEIPGFAKVLTTMRRALTWPARKLLQFCM